MGNVEKIMAIAIGIALCTQRLSMAAGSIFWGISIACFLYLLYQSYKAGDLKERAKNYMGYYKVFGFMLLCFVPSVIFSTDVKVSAKAFVEMWIYRMLPFFMVTLFLQKKEYLTRIMTAFLIATGIDCLVAMYQVQVMHEFRGWGFGGHSLNLASLLCLLIPMTIVVLFDSRFSSRAKKLCGLVLVCFVIGIIAGKSRGAWLTLGIILPLVAATYAAKSKKILAICLIAVLVIGVGFASNPKFQQRLVSITNTTTDTSNADRIRVWKSCENMIKDYPLTGVGLGQWRKIYNEGHYRLKTTKQDLPHSHNNVLQLWTEGGTIGIIGYTVMVAFLLFTNFMNWWKSKNPYSLMIWSAWLGFTIFGVFDLIIDHSAITKAWWFMLAMLLYFRQNETL